jgi:hypothetical protein
LETATKEVFYTSEIFYKKSGDDSLIVYAPYSSIKKDVKGQIGSVKLIVMSLATADDINQFELKYKAKGLSRLDAYD